MKFSHGDGNNHQPYFAPPLCLCKTRPSFPVAIRVKATTEPTLYSPQVADILFLLVCVPFTAADYAFTSAWPFGDLWCKINQFLIVATAFVSIYTLVLMALDRSDRVFILYLLESIFLQILGGSVPNNFQDHPYRVEYSDGYST